MRLRGGDGALDQLADVPLFSSCSRKELRLLARAADRVQVPAGKVLVEEGRPGHEFFLILAGTATVRRGGTEVATLGPGEHFGELALLDRGPRSATVVADTELELLVLGQREFSAVVDEVPSLAHKLLAKLAQRLRDADARMGAPRHPE